MTVTVKHSKTNAISDWTQAQLDEQIELGNFAPGTTLADIVLPSDWNNDHTLTGLGTMAEQDATAVAITGGTINNTTIGATTATTGVFTGLSSNGVTSFTNGSTNLTFTDGGGTVNPLYLIGQTTGLGRNRIHSQPQLRLTTNNNPIQFHTGAGTAAASDGNVQFVVSHTTSAVNYVQVTGGVTGVRPSLTVAGSDATIGLNIAAKGGEIVFLNNGVGTNAQFSTTFTAASVNYLTATGSGATGNAPKLYAQGTDTNISMAFQPKGTGAIDLAAGSSGVNISNGGTVTAITRTNAGSAYTTIPSVAVSAPTTAGGVTATASINQMFVSGATISNGGTGYTAGNVLTVSGGTQTGVAQITVSTVSGGVITGITVSSAGAYSVLPTNPVSVTGGSGSGATFNLTWAVISFTITNAGSGYIEQPTITFSGGGGSGAAAYATVGSGTIVRGIGSTMDFANPNGVGLRVNSTAISSNLTDYVELSGGASGVTNGVYVRAGGSTTNNSLYIQSKGTGSISFFTNWTTGAAEQLRASHTASAVNYVQVTGAATTGTPVVQAQGSDTNVSLAIRAKGGGNLFFQPNSLNQFAVTQTASAVNYLQATGSAAGSAPAFSVAGTDTNIDLALTPKGTGLVRFGTYVAGALTATGYINIKAADGTTYKVLVST